MAVTKHTSKNHVFKKMDQSLLKRHNKSLSPALLNSDTKSKPTTSALSLSLQALTLAALSLPGLMPMTAQGAEDEVSLLYGFYEEGPRNLSGVKSRFSPITANSLSGSTNIKLTDRVKFGFSYEQDHAGTPGTWTIPGMFGVPAQYLPPTLTGNRVKYVVQTPLTAGITYSFSVYQAEVQNYL